MKAWLAFTKKEFVEGFRTYKFVIMLAVFLLIGVTNPLTAKLTPQLMETLMPEGMKITLPEPTALDSWAQFFKNVPQMGLLVLVIVLSTMMSGEFSRGTLVNILTKGLPRNIVILSKFTMAASVWTLSYLVCFTATYGYTLYFWKDSVANLVLSVFCLWLFGILLIGALLLGGVLFRSSYGCLLFTGGFVVVLFILDILPKLRKYNPVALASGNMALLTGDMAAGDFIFPSVIGGAAAAGFILCAIVLFNKKQI